MKVKNLSFSYNQKSFIKDLNIEFGFPKGSTKDDSKKITLRDIIWDLQDTAIPSGEKNRHNPEAINNNE